MSDRMIPVPESSLRALAEWIERHRDARTYEMSALVACLPEPEPTFTDEEALAYGDALFPEWPDKSCVSHGRKYLTRLAKAGWTAPKALCPPPSPALVELVEAARAAEFTPTCPNLNRLRAAVAAYDEEG